MRALGHGVENALVWVLLAAEENLRSGSSEQVARLGSVRDGRTRCSRVCGRPESARRMCQIVDVAS